MPKPTCVEICCHRLSSTVLQGAAIATVLVLAACSQGNVVDLGENLVEPAGSPGARCQQSDTIEGDVTIESQEQLNELEGCKAIRGNLEIRKFPDADLRPLHALTTVEGGLVLSSRGGQDPGDGPTRDSDDIGLEPGQWFSPSLEGLEQLERVGSLSLEWLGTDSLAPLTGLRVVDYALDLRSLPQLTDLSGLENVVSLRGLYVSQCENLRDLSALHLPGQLEFLAFQDTAVRGLDASDLSYVGTLLIDRTLLTDLNAFVALGGVEQLFIQDNDVLEDVSALDALLTVDQFSLEGNPLLQRLTLENLTSFRSLSIGNNDTLVTLPSFANIANVAKLPPSVPVWNNGDFTGNVYINGNRALQRFVLPPYSRAYEVQITRNAQLHEIVFSSLQGADYLAIEDNPALVNVDLGSLSAAAYLSLQNNPLWNPSAFDSVRSIERTMTGNAP